MGITTITISQIDFANSLCLFLYRGARASAAQARIKRLQDAATSMQSDVAALSTAKSSEEALRLISGIVKAYDGELYR